MYVHVHVHAPYILRAIRFIREWVFHGVHRDLYREFLIDVNYDYLSMRGIESKVDVFCSEKALSVLWQCVGVFFVYTCTPTCTVFDFRIVLHSIRYIGYHIRGACTCRCICNCARSKYIAPSCDT